MNSHTPRSTFGTLSSHAKFMALPALALCLLASRLQAADDNHTGWNMVQAARYLDERAQSWFAFSGAERGKGTTKVSCISCHTLLPYALARPALRRLTGSSKATVFEARIISQVQARVENWQELDCDEYRLYYDFSEQKKKESRGTEAVLYALILAFDDYYGKQKSAGASTKMAMAHLWQAQITQGDHTGSWEWLDFGLEPWETKDARYFGATLAALAVGTAPYYAAGASADLDQKITSLRGYLRRALESQSLHNRVWLLWASAKLDGLLTSAEQQMIIATLNAKQRRDGGWSFAALGVKTPLSASLPDESSDSYATALILHVFQTTGVPRSADRVLKGLTWLRAHQEPTGAWIANSVNKKRDPASHVGKFMSDAATAYAALALSH